MLDWTDLYAASIRFSIRRMQAKSSSEACFSISSSTLTPDVAICRSSCVFFAISSSVCAFIVCLMQQPVVAHTVMHSDAWVHGMQRSNARQGTRAVLKYVELGCNKGQEVSPAHLGPCLQDWDHSAWDHHHW